MKTSSLIVIIELLKEKKKKKTPKWFGGIFSNPLHREIHMIIYVNYINKSCDSFKKSRD